MDRDLAWRRVRERVRDMAAERDSAEQTAALATIVTVGSSFGPGLLPRGGLDQAIATGIVAAIEHGLVTTSQSGYAALARRIVPDGRTRPGLVHLLAAQSAVGVGVAGAGLTVQRLLPPRPGESLRRSLVRMAGRRAIRVGLTGAAMSIVSALDAASDGHRPGLRAVAAAGGVVAGAAFASVRIHQYHSGEKETAALDRQAAIDPLSAQLAASGGSPPEAGPPALAPVPPVVRSLLIGGAVSGGLHALSVGESLAARALAAAVRRIAPGAGPLAEMTGHAVAFGALLTGLGVAMEYVDRRAETGGAAIDAAYTSPPDLDSVSGGPSSRITWPTLSREGVRFVNTPLSRQEIASVTQAPPERVLTPVRAFAGLASAETVDMRVDLVMEDLTRLGAFDRAVLCVASPTGSGYVNHVAVETLEYLTRGDCATVALQYSLRPSFLSLDRVAMGREQNRVLLHAVEWRLRGMPPERRPRLVGFGESLGAHTLQDAFLHEGVAGLHRVGMERALFLGTPAGSGWARRWRLDPERTDPGGEVAEVASYAEWLALAEERRERCRYVLLSHHADPITRFEPALAVRQPDWLGPLERRPPGISPLAAWRPLTTFILTAVDMKNALTTTPGVFTVRGHDYRADLARMVAAAFGLPVSESELMRIERALRHREAAWARRRDVAERVRKAAAKAGWSGGQAGDRRKADSLAPTSR